MGKTINSQLPTERKNIFENLLEIDTKRQCRDSSGENDFFITDKNISDIAGNLAQWWDDEYENVELTNEYAKEFIEEIYPEID